MTKVPASGEEQPAVFTLHTQRGSHKGSRLSSTSTPPHIDLTVSVGLAAAQQHSSKRGRREICLASLETTPTVLRLQQRCAVSAHEWCDAGVGGGERQRRNDDRGITSAVLCGGVRAARSLSSHAGYPYAAPSRCCIHPSIHHHHLSPQHRPTRALGSRMRVLLLLARGEH